MTQSEFSNSAEITEVLSKVTGEEDSIFPIRALISLLDGYHDFTGFSWWVVIASSTFVLRIALFPFIILQLNKVKQISEFLPKLPPPFPPPLSGRSYKEQFMLFSKKRKSIGCPSILWFLAAVSIQTPCFILGVTTIRRMSLNHHPGFDNGGALWFQNLTELPHGFWGAIFPLLIAGLHVANVQLPFSKFSIREMTGQIGLFFKSYKFFMDGLVLPILFVGFFVPQGSLVYWVTNSSLSLIQQLCINNQHVRKYFRLPVKDGASVPAKNPQEIGAPDVKILDISSKQQKVSVKNLMPKELVNLSIQILANGHKERALPILRLALDKDPEHIRSLIVLGQTLLQDGLLAEAGEYLERAVSRILLMGPPTKVEEVDQLILASLWGGVAYIRQGRNAEGILHLERIGHMKEPEDAKSKSHYYDGLLMLASALTNEGRKAEAEKYLRMAAAYNSTYNLYLEQLQNEEDHFVSNLVNSKRGDH